MQLRATGESPERSHSPAGQSLDHVAQYGMTHQSHAKDQSKTDASTADRNHNRRFRFRLHGLR